MANFTQYPINSNNNHSINGIAVTNTNKSPRGMSTQLHAQLALNLTDLLNTSNNTNNSQTAQTNIHGTTTPSNIHIKLSPRSAEQSEKSVLGTQVSELGRSNSVPKHLLNNTNNNTNINIDNNTQFDPLLSASHDHNDTFTNNTTNNIISPTSKSHNMHQRNQLHSSFVATEYNTNLLKLASKQSVARDMTMNFE